MDAKLNPLLPTPISPSTVQKPSASRKAAPHAPASDFSQVLSGQMFKDQQQALSGSPSATAGLQVVPLGKSMNVITSNAALPDVTTLADFARSQGFAESTVQALFGPK